MKNPLKPKTDKIILGHPIANIVRRRRYAGNVGLEIEVEGRRFPKEQGQLPDEWGYHHDGSLRGEDNAEYVLNKPVSFEDVPKVIGNLWETFRKYDSVLDESNRTSVHVHLNVQKFHMNRLASFLALYFTLEEILTAWCGDHRVGNLFCLRAKDAPAIISFACDYIKKDGECNLSEHLHYAGMNLQALQKFGSLEIRTLRGCTEPQTILDWLGILERIYNLSDDFVDPREICGMFSGEGPLAFYNNVLGPYAMDVANTAGFDEMAIRESLYSGIRMAQDICYCRDWSKFATVPVSDDPFDRIPGGPQQVTTFSELFSTSTAGTPVFATTLDTNPFLVWQQTDTSLTASATTAFQTVPEDPEEDDYEWVPDGYDDYEEDSE